MTDLIIFSLQLVVGGVVAYFLCQGLVLWLLPILRSAGRESRAYGVEGPTVINLVFRGLLLLYFGIAWVSFCVAAAFHIATNADSWLWWLYFIISFIWSFLILSRAVRYLGDPILAMNVSQGPYQAEMMEFFGNIIGAVVMYGCIAAFIVFWIWPNLISNGFVFVWVEWLISYSVR